MIFGQSFSSGFGEPDHMLAGMDAEQRGTTIDVTLYGRLGFGDSYFGVYLNCALIQTVWLPDGTTSQVISLPAPEGDVSIHALSNGWCAGLDQSNVARGLDSETSTDVTVHWDWSYDFLPTIMTDGTLDTDLTEWAITGLTPESGTMSSTLNRSVNVLLYVDSYGNGTVSIPIGQTTITGTGAGNTYITLSDGNGVTGTVWLAGGIVEGAYTKTLQYRYPAFTIVYRDSVNVGTANFNGLQSGSFTDMSLPSGTYSYTLVNMSDTNVASVVTTPVVVQVEIVPAPITDLAYYSGNESATVISWTASPTPNVVYNVYVRKIGSTHIDTIEPYMTVSSPSALLTNLGVSGVAEVMVRVLSTVSGLEEKNPFILEMEYDVSGNYVPPRPNVIRITSAGTSGLTVKVAVMYPTEGEKGVATKARLYSSTVGYPRSFGTAVDEQDLVDDGNGFMTATLSCTASNGVRVYVARAATAAGVEGSNSQEQTLLVSDSEQPPINVSVTTSRG